LPNKSIVPAPLTFTVHIPITAGTAEFPLAGTGADTGEVVKPMSALINTLPAVLTENVVTRAFAGTHKVVNDGSALWAMGDFIFVTQF
jgi:hypothetical protein